MPPPYELVIFDLDGTLIDSQRGIVLSVQHTLRQLGIQEEDPERLRRFIGPPLADSFKAHYGLDDATAWRAVETYRAHFVTAGIYENTVYPGVPQLLAGLRAAGVTLVLATSKYGLFAEEVLRHRDLRRWFWRVVGSKEDGARATKTEVIAAALEGIGAAARMRTAMIGDHPHDVLGARANGIAAIAVTYGYGDAEELRRAGPDALVGSIEALRGLLLEV
jgi:phosphoglycolate phosphatase